MPAMSFPHRASWSRLYNINHRYRIIKINGDRVLESEDGLVISVGVGPIGQFVNVYTQQYR
jgi:hypothetical protein